MNDEYTNTQLDQTGQGQSFPPQDEPTQTSADTNSQGTPQPQTPKADAIMDDEIINKFIDGLIEAKGYKSLTGEALEKVKSDLRSLLAEYINASIFSALPEEKLNALEQALETGDKEKVLDVFRNAGIDYSKVIGDALIGFGNTYLGARDDRKSS